MLGDARPTPVHCSRSSSGGGSDASQAPATYNKQHQSPASVVKAVGDTYHRIGPLLQPCTVNLDMLNIGDVAWVGVKLAAPVSSDVLSCYSASTLSGRVVANMRDLCIHQPYIVTVPSVITHRGTICILYILAVVASWGERLCIAVSISEGPEKHTRQIYHIPASYAG